MVFKVIRFHSKTGLVQKYYYSVELANGESNEI